VVTLLVCRTLERTSNTQSAEIEIGSHSLSFAPAAAITASNASMGFGRAAIRAPVKTRIR
jgi:RNA 3'-terminal phosphate cyclase